MGVSQFVSSNQPHPLVHSNCNNADNNMASLLLAACLFLQCMDLGTRAQSVNPSQYAPTTTTDYDALMPYYTSTTMEDSTQYTQSIVALDSQQQLLPTPTPTGANGSGDNGIITPLPENSTSIFSSMISPSPTNIYKVTQPVPTPDIIIKLRLNISVDLSDQQRMQVEQNLSLFVQDILQLSISPEVSQEPGNIFNVLIVSSSSNNSGIASGSIDAISVLLAGVHANRLLGDVDAVEIISIDTLYQPTTEDSPSMTIDHLDFPLWQWFVYALCTIIVITATTLLICACCYRCTWKKNQQSRRRRGYKHLLHSPHRPDEMVDFVQPGELQEHDPAISRKVSRITFRPRGPMQLLSHPLTPEELLDFTLNPIAVYAEYSSIPSNMVTMAEVPPGAEEKNRFKDVLPNPHTRVALFLKFAVPNSDYINANYIRGYRDAPKAYIATQGPLYWTVADFWRMVWEQKCSTIIMVTGLEERGMNKCARYWPDERVQHITTYEDLELMLKRKTSNKYFTTTTFHLRHKQKLVTREVTHFWFTAWPDHGVPSSARPVVEFLLKARHHIRDIPGPTVVHCSAGIGRTGVFIGAEIGMQQLDEKGEVDILKIVSTLRQDRGGMVQTKDQYLFLYQVLVEYSNYLDEVRSPYKLAPVATRGHDIARQPALISPGTGAAGPMAIHSSRRVQLEPPREEDEEEEEDSSSTE